MPISDQWLRLNPSVRACWVIKGFFASLIMPLILGSVFFIEFIDFGMILLLFYLIFILIINVIVILWAVMFYNRYTYQIGEKSINIKRGILWKKDVTIPYERIQHVSTTRGPIEQLLGLHIINIFTAGTASVGAGFGGSAGMFAAEGYIPGITNPEEMKTFIMDRVKESKSGSGLGDKIEKSEKKSMRTKTMDTEILDELKKIRMILEKSSK